MSQTNYYTRSNYFKVKHEMRKAFEKFIEACEGILTIKAEDNSVNFSFSLRDSIPSGIYAEENIVEELKKVNIELNEDEEFDFMDILSKFLDGDSVAIVMESSGEVINDSVLYAGGRAIAINSQGQSKDISTDNIYGMALSLGKVETR